ncbi:response regulator transcription factor [Herbaspirillum sp. WKF16]|jgi:DNA-binding response OmpR family regulator|uniref:response regulator transcription factor n=1 Tax=Herbaspirillum sp. WKF16 TaxID=3028312 RepID=UPI0023A92495|nr:response regulator transcription factor [Herbaspirillum sp. WKF16]WDZ95276.1 response regulator transcription factor [Herbaspirillum sp. WKF16]
MKVLIVEHENDWREMLAGHIGGLGYEASGCSSLAEALVILKSRQPDILVADVGLPDGNLLPELASIRQHFPSMGIVILTATTRFEDRVRGMSEGADYYMVKPVRLEEVSATLTALARRMKTASHESLPQAEKWSFNRKSGRLSSNGSVALQFTDKESTALAALLQSPNYPVSHNQLFDLLRSGAEEYDAHRIDALIYRVRQKLRSMEDAPMQIRNIYGEGFLMLRRSTAVDIVLDS